MPSSFQAAPCLPNWASCPEGPGDPNSFGGNLPFIWQDLTRSDKSLSVLQSHPNLETENLESPISGKPWRTRGWGFKKMASGCYGSQKTWCLSEQAMSRMGTRKTVARTPWQLSRGSFSAGIDEQSWCLVSPQLTSDYAFSLGIHKTNSKRSFLSSAIMVIIPEC